MSASSPQDTSPLVCEAWRRCTQRLLPPLPPTTDAALFRRYIYDRYSEPQRHYHNLLHLEEMLGHLCTYETEHGWHGDCAPALVDTQERSPTGTSRPCGSVPHEWVRTVLLLSVLFHDAVYDPKRGDNEEKSAELAQDFLREAENLYKTAQSKRGTEASCARHSAAPPSASVLWENTDAVQFVCAATNDYILKTKVHLSVPPTQTLRLAAPPTPHVIASSHDDPLHVFLDLDLAILGSPDPELYRSRYAANVAREYSHYPLADFLKGRAAFLGGFLGNAQWYKTPFFFARLEAQARRNTTAEVAELQARLAQLDTTAKAHV